MNSFFKAFPIQAVAVVALRSTVCFSKGWRAPLGREHELTVVESRRSAGVQCHSVVRGHYGLNQDGFQYARCL